MTQNTVQNLADSGISPGSISSWMAPFRRTAHRLSSILILENDADSGVVTRNMSPAGWNDGYLYRVRNCNPNVQILPAGMCYGSTVEKPVKVSAGSPWYWQQAYIGTQQTGVCAELSMATATPRLEAVGQAAVEILNEELDAALDAMLWCPTDLQTGDRVGPEEAPGAFSNIPIGRVLGADPGNLDALPDVLTIVELFDRMISIAQCQPRRQAFLMSGANASILEGAGRIIDRNGVLETRVGRHRVATGCWDWACSPGGIRDLTPAEINAGFSWVGLMDEPHGRIGGLWVPSDGEDPKMQETASEFRWTPNPSVNKIELIVERSIAMNAGRCTHVAGLAQTLSPDYCPVDLSSLGA